jgi:hypothetical protein
MKHLVVLIVALATMTALGQNPDPPKTDGFAFSSLGYVPPMPMNVHDYALQKVKEYDDYQRSRDRQFMDVEMPYIFSFHGPNGVNEQSFAVHKDGTIDFTNVTPDDVILWLYAFDLERRLSVQQKFDKADDERKEAESSVPPARFRIGPQHWHTENVPDWSLGSGVLADTNCNAKRLRFIIHGPNKQTSMMHELLHVATGCKDNLEVHSWIYEASPTLLKLLQENPDLVKYLTTKTVTRTGGHK